jgi:hypothetical protein
MPDLIFDVLTPIGFTVRCTRQYWKFIVTHKHPILAGREEEVKSALQEPSEIRRSRKDPAVYLFYREVASRWICAVARRDEDSGFLITAYPTDTIKAGEATWTRSK